MQRQNLMEHLRALYCFFEDVEQLADYAALDHEQRIKCAIRYAPIDEAEVWALEPEAKGKDWDKFIAVIKAMYPGCEGDRRYTRTEPAPTWRTSARSNHTSQCALRKSSDSTTASSTRYLSTSSIRRS